MLDTPTLEPAQPAPVRRRRKRRPPKPKVDDPRVAEKFRANVITDSDYTIPSAPWLGPCHLWTGPMTPAGYGSLTLGRAKWGAHQVAWRLEYGKPAFPTIDHLCHSYSWTCPGGAPCIHKLCVNVLHLEPVSTQENSRRANRGNRFSRQFKPVVAPICSNGHRWGPHLALYDASGQRVCGDCAEGMY